MILKARHHTARRTLARQAIQAEVQAEVQADQDEWDAAVAAYWQAQEDALEAELAAEEARFQAMDDEYRSQHPATDWNCFSDVANDAQIAWAKEVASRFDLDAYADDDMEDWRDSMYNKAHWSHAHQDRAYARCILHYATIACC